MSNPTTPEAEMAQPTHTSERTFTGWHMLASMLAFFGVIIAVNLTMAVLASSSWTGLIVKNGYVASKDFNGKLAAARQQADRGWHAEPAYDGGRFSLRLTDSEGRPVLLDALAASYGRPVSSAADATTVLTHAGNGLYLAEQRLEKGLWQISFEGRSAQGPYRLDMRILVDNDGRGELQAGR